MTTPVFPVLFVGAGPGDPELITVKGQKALAHADLIIYTGSLVPESLLMWKQPCAETINSAGLDLDQVIGLMETAVLKGLRVVRLHTGDPSLYGAILEQIRAMQHRSITVQVIPGITAAFAAAAAMGLEYTLPQVTQTLILTRIAGRTPVPPEESLESLAAHGCSMAIYLSIGHVEQVETILSASYGPDHPCALAYKIGHPQESIVVTPVKQLARTAHENRFFSQTLIIVGKAVEAAMGDTQLLKSKLYDAGFSHGFRKAAHD